MQADERGSIGEFLVGTREADGAMTGIDVQQEVESPEGTALLAGVVFEGGDQIDALVAEVIGSIQDAGVVVAGVVQERMRDEATGARNLRLRGLMGGWERPILQNRGQAARGCRLDASAIAEVAMHLEEAFSVRTDLMIVNRFGRAESEGHGLRHILERTAFAEIPLLIGVRENYVPAWQAFHGGLGVEIAPDHTAIMNWWRGIRLGFGPQ